MKEEEAARCPELGAEVPNVNSTEGGRGAMFVPFARKEAQWYGALADGGASRNSVLDKPTDVGEEGRELEAMMVMPTCGRRTCRKRSGMASQWPRVGSMRSAMAMALEGARVELAQE